MLRHYQTFYGALLLLPSIAIIGASKDRSKYGNKALRAYAQRGDTVYPVHPAQPEVEGLKTYASVLDVPDEIDVATFYVPPIVGLKVIEECVQKGIERVLLNPGAQMMDCCSAPQSLASKRRWRVRFYWRDTGHGVV